MSNENLNISDVLAEDYTIIKTSELERLRADSSFVDGPRDGNLGFALTRVGEIMYISSFEYASDSFESGNWFATEEEANKARQKRLAKQRIIQFIKKENHKTGFVADFSDFNQEKCHMVICDNKVNWCLSDEAQFTENEFYFNRRSCKEVIENCADDFKIYMVC